MFRKNVVFLAGGTAIGQGIVVLASPLLTRLYNPNDFGTFAVYVALLGIVAVVASLRYELAIPLPKEDQAAACVTALSLGIVVLMTMLSGTVVWLFGESLARWVKTPQLTPYLWLLPFGILGAGTFKVLNYWSIRKKYFSHVALSKVSQGAGVVAVQIGLGLTVVGSIGLLAGQAVGQFFGIFTLSFQAYKNDKTALQSIRYTEIVRVMRQYRRFPLFSSWSAIFNTISAYAPVLMLSFFFGPALTGLYALGLRVVQAPVTLVGQAISQVFISTAAQKNREGQLAGATLSIFRRLVQVGLPGALLLGLAAPEIFALVFGTEWREAGVYAQMLAPWLFFVFVSVPLSLLPSVLGKQRQEMFFNCSLLVSRVAVLYIAGVLGNSTYAIGSFALVSALFYVAFMVWLMKISGNKTRHVFRIIGKQCLVVVPILLPLIAAKVYWFDGRHDFYIFIASLFCLSLIIFRLYNSFSKDTGFTIKKIYQR